MATVEMTTTYYSNTSSLPPEEEDNVPPVYYAMRIVSIICITILVFSSNILALIVIPRTKMASNSKFLLLSLCRADLIVGFVALFAVASSIMNEWPYGTFMCYVVGTLIYAFVTVAVFSLLILSVDRYLAISKPLHYNTIVTKKRLRIAVVISWLYPFAMFCYTFFSQRPVKYSRHRCTCYRVLPDLGKNPILDDSDMRIAMAIVTIVVAGTGITAFMLLFVHLRIYCITRSQIKAIQDISVATPEGRVSISIKAGDKKALRMIAVTTLIFVVAWPPLLITDMFLLSGYPVPEPLEFSVYWLSVSSSWIQVFALVVTSDDFRYTLGKVLKRCIEVVNCVSASSGSVQDRIGSNESRVRPTSPDVIAVISRPNDL